MLNSAAEARVNACIENAERLRISFRTLDCGATILDFGINVHGGIEAGLELARICLADQATVQLCPADSPIWNSPIIQVYTDRPVEACMASQYAGWPVKLDDFFAMGSGPMRACRGREAILEELNLIEDSSNAIGVLECDQIPSDAVCQMIARECRVEPEALTVCVAPTRSMAGTIQVVARSIETSLHKLHELGFDLRQVLSAQGASPLPPPTPDFADGIGRTNDSILYGGRVQLWVEADDESLESLGPKVPSGSSKDWGKPFSETFRNYKYDFYQVDPGLFSPAEITFFNLRTGRAFRFGQWGKAALESSFGYNGS
jgi:methenyltetrahydromethanopterin cyclohydrolase